MSYLIKTYTKSQHEITDEQEIKLRSMSGGDKIVLKDGSTVLVNNIAEIIKLKDDSPRYQKIEAPRIVFTKERYIRGLEQMIKGFKEHFGEREMPPQSKAMLKHMQEKLDAAQKAPADAKFKNPAADFHEPMWDFIHK